MRTVFTATLLSAMALSSVAIASPAAPEDNRTQGMHVQVIAGHRAILPDFEFKSLQGEYQMSDGRTLDVSGEGRTLYATLDGHARTELIPMGSNTFSTRDDMILTFERQSNHRNDVTVNMPRK